MGFLNRLVHLHFLNFLFALVHFVCMGFLNMVVHFCRAGLFIGMVHSQNVVFLFYMVHLTITGSLQSNGSLLTKRFLVRLDSLINFGFLTDSVHLCLRFFIANGSLSFAKFLLGEVIHFSNGDYFFSVGSLIQDGFLSRSDSLTYCLFFLLHAVHFFK